MHRRVSSTTALLTALSVPAYPPKSTLKTKRPGKSQGALFYEGKNPTLLIFQEKSLKFFILS
jgi:hypothetical protein